MRPIQSSLLFVLLLAACTHGPLTLERERRFSDGIFSGFSSRVVEYSQIAGNGDSLYFGTKGGRLYSVSAEDGAKRWTTDLEGSIDTQPGFGAGRVLVGTSKGRFYSIRASDGHPEWHYDVPGVIIGQPVVLESTVLFGANDGVVYALSAGDGTLKWRYRRDLPDRMTVADFAGAPGEGGIVYTAFSDGSVAALKLENGDVVWVKSFPAAERFSDVTSLLLLDQSLLLAGQFDGSLYAVRRDGEIQWTFPHGGTAASPLARKDDLFVPTSGNRLAMLDPARGTKKWEFDAKDTARWSGLALFGPYLLGSTYEGKIYVLDPGHGTLTWTYDFGAPVQGAPVVVGNRAWILTRKGRLFSVAIR